MLNEIEEFKAYTTFPDYTIKNSKDNRYLGRFTYDILKDHYALNRVFMIIARGYMWETDEPDADRARRALCAWCSLPEEKAEKTVNFPAKAKKGLGKKRRRGIV